MLFVGEPNWIHFLFPIRIKDNDQGSLFLIFGAGNVPLMEKPGS